MIKSKRRMSLWMWILVILIVFAVGSCLYFFLTGGDGALSLLGGGSSIPQPPALPSG